LDDKSFNGEVEDRIGKIKLPEESNMITVMEELSNGNIKTTAYSPGTAPSWPGC
jgi:hypothetical protein